MPHQQRVVASRSRSCKSDASYKDRLLGPASIGHVHRSVLSEHVGDEYFATAASMDHVQRGALPEHADIEYAATEYSS